MAQKRINDKIEKPERNQIRRGNPNVECMDTMIWYDYYVKFCLFYVTKTWDQALGKCFITFLRLPDCLHCYPDGFCNGLV